MITIKNISKSQISERAGIFNNEILPQFKKVLSKDIQDQVIQQESEEDISLYIDKGYKYQFIYNDSILIGSCYFKEKNIDTAYINGFYIRPQYQRDGYGNRALDILIDSLGSYKHIYWETRVEYIWATSFYKKKGYESLSSSESLENHYLSKYYKTLAPGTILYYIYNN